MKSHNFSIIKDLISKSKNYNLADNHKYVIIYSFLYKFCSDHLKDYFQVLSERENITFNESYKNIKYRKLFKQESFDFLGYYIKSPDAFFDEVINSNYFDNSFLTNFFKLFRENIIFDEDSNIKKYFELIFKTVSDNIHVNMQNISQIKDIIFYISKLDVFEEEFKFQEAFEIFASSDLMNIESNPKYISQVLSFIMSSQKNYIKTVYDPFLKDGTSILNLSHDCALGIEKCYGKEDNKLTYCYSIVKFFINYFNLDYVILKQGNAMKSVEFDDLSFDAIISKIPMPIKNYSSFNINQKMELIKRNKRNKLEQLMFDTFDISSDTLTKNSQLNKAFNDFINNLDFDEKSFVDFGQEYASLYDSEFLFLINLINSLKDDGIMAISISENFLYNSALNLFRKYLSYEKNYIDSIILLPEIIDKTKKPEVIVVFKKNKNEDDILFVDLKNNFKIQRDNTLFSNLFKGNGLFDDETLVKLGDVYLNRLMVDKLSNLVNISEIQSNDFNLSVSRYVDTFDGEFIRLSDLKEEKEKLDHVNTDLNFKIGKMMDELDIGF